MDAEWNLFEPDADGGDKLRYFQRTQETPGAVLRKDAHLAKSQAAPNSSFIIKGRRQVKSDKEAKTNGNQREDQSETEELRSRSD